MAGFVKWIFLALIYTIYANKLLKFTSAVMVDFDEQQQRNDSSKNKFYEMTKNRSNHSNPAKIIDKNLLKNILLQNLTLLEHQFSPKNLEELKRLLSSINETCRLLALIDDANSDKKCPYFFDRVVCWRPTAYNSTATTSCPIYIEGFQINSGRKVSINCTENGNWSYGSSRDEFDQVYSVCKKPEADNRNSLQIIEKARSIGIVGYSVSFFTLLCAVALFVNFKRLHCSRNFIHLHLFIAFAVRGLMCILKEALFTNNQCFDFDGPLKPVFKGDQGIVLDFETPGPHWESKLFATVWNYALVASYFWLLVEALYLHNSVYFFVFKESKACMYIIFGWVAPILVMIPWVIVKVKKDDYLCWFSYGNLNYFWVQRGPIMIVVVVNFLLFINVMRELYMKLRETHITENRRYRKLAKSSFFLIILFGVDYFIMTWPILMMDPNKLTLPLAISLSTEYILSSIQGFFVAVVYCFVNSEVRHEVKSRWRRYLANYQMTTTATTSSSSSGRRSSCKQNPTNVGVVGSIWNYFCGRHHHRQLREQASRTTNDISTSAALSPADIVDAEKCCHLAAEGGCRYHGERKRSSTHTCVTYGTSLSIGGLNSPSGDYNSRRFSSFDKQDIMVPLMDFSS